MDGIPGKRTHVTRRSIRMVAEDLHKKLDLLRHNPNIYEAFQDRISHHRRSQMQKVREELIQENSNAQHTYFIERNRQIIKREEMVKSRQEKVASKHNHTILSLISHLVAKSLE